MCWLQVVGTLYSHHQKVVIVDTEGPSNMRKLTSFIGGLDLTGGRWDTPSHLLFSSLQNEHKGDFRNKSFTVSFGLCWFRRSRTTMFNMSARFGLAHVSFCTCQSKFLGGSPCMLMLQTNLLMEKREIGGSWQRIWCNRLGQRGEGQENHGMIGTAGLMVMLHMMFSPTLSSDGERPPTDMMMSSLISTAFQGSYLLQIKPHPMGTHP